ncbi:glycoside hydrolase N-terminal domain-containing protein [Kitasatospora sp. NPDC052868]|uniref:glycoside hydrolase N-terminal domain-containing protein n=1 Tax=Kitasatospora sp. NPDC052868 TaxID=3364060 RepID=UPI0037CAE2D4
MKVRLAYGGTGLDIDVDPAVTTVVEPPHHPGAADETAVLRDALRHPVAGPPLLDAGLGKADVRAVSRLWSLPTWDKPATPCLAGRIRYGIPVTGHRLARVDRAETKGSSSTRTPCGPAVPVPATGRVPPSTCPRCGMRVLRDRDQAGAHAIAAAHFPGPDTEAYQPLGTLLLTFPSCGEDDATDYRRELDLDEAVHTVSFTAGGVRYRRECGTGVQGAGPRILRGPVETVRSNGGRTRAVRADGASPEARGAGSGRLLAITKCGSRLLRMRRGVVEATAAASITWHAQPTLLARVRAGIGIGGLADGRRARTGTSGPRSVTLPAGAGPTIADLRRPASDRAG